MAGVAERPVLRALAMGAARLFVIVALLIAWEWLAQSGRVTPYMLPAPRPMQPRANGNTSGPEAPSVVFVVVFMRRT